MKYVDCAVRHLMDFACCAAVRGSGANKEYAHHVLNLCHGDVRVCYLLCLELYLFTLSGS